MKEDFIFTFVTINPNLKGEIKMTGTELIVKNLNDLPEEVFKSLNTEQQIAVKEALSKGNAVLYKNGKLFIKRILKSPSILNIRVNDIVNGTLMEIQESRSYEDNYLLKIQTDEGQINLYGCPMVLYQMVKDMSLPVHLTIKCVGEKKSKDNLNYRLFEVEQDEELQSI